MFYPFILMDIQAGQRADRSLDRRRGPAAGAVARADHAGEGAGAAGIDRQDGGGGGGGGGVLRHGAAGGLRASGRTRSLRRAGGMVLSAVHPALCASLRAGGRGRRLLHRVGDARADADPRLGRRLSGGARARATLAEEVRAILGPDDQDRLCGGLVGVFRAPAGRRIGRRALPSRSALGVAGDRFRRHRQLHAAVGLARRGGPCRRGGGVDLRSRLPHGATSPVARGTTGTMPTPRGGRRRTRLPITDGAYGEDWVFRYKDLVELVVPAARQPAGRREGAAADGLAAAVEADLVHRARLPGGEQGHEPAERLPRSEVVGELLSRTTRTAAGTTSSSTATSRRCSRTGTSRRTTRCRTSMAGGWSTWRRAHVWAWDARPWPDFPEPAGDLGRRRQLRDAATG